MLKLADYIFNDSIEFIIFDYLKIHHDITLFEIVAEATALRKDLKFVIEIEVYGKKIMLDYLTMLPLVENPDDFLIVLNNFTNSALE